MKALALILVAAALARPAPKPKVTASPTPTPSPTPTATPTVVFTPNPELDKIFVPGESHTYQLVFIDTQAAEMTFQFVENTEWNGIPAYHFRSHLSTVKLIGTLYPYTQTVDIYCDRQKFEPLYADSHITYKKKTQRTQIHLDQKSLRGDEIEDSQEGDEKNHRKKFWDVTPGAQGLFTVLHFMRTLPLKTGYKIEFPVSHDEKNTKFGALVSKIETVRTGKEEREAFQVMIEQGFAKVFANVRSEPLVWYANDEHKTMLRFELPHKYGRVIGTLKSPK